MPQKTFKTVGYTIFKTSWGWFGLVGCHKGLCRTYLPRPSREELAGQILARMPDARFEKDLFAALQRAITAYFEGACADLAGIVPLCLDDLAPFSRRLLRACAKVPFGRTVTYGQLAEMAGSPGAARAAGQVLAANPLPLVIPCHRVIKADGSLGGFTAPGGTKLKRRLLKLERRASGEGSGRP